MQNKSRSICVVIPQTGGAQLTHDIAEHCNNLALNLASKIKSVVVCNAGKEAYHPTCIENRYTRHGIGYVDLKTHPCDTSQFLLFNEPLSASYKLDLWLSENSFDAVHFPDSLGIGFFALRNRRLHASHPKTRFIMFAQAPATWTAETNSQYLHDPQAAFMERYCARHSDAIVWSNEEIRQWVQRHQYPLAEEQYDEPATHIWFDISFANKQKTDKGDNVASEPLVSVCMPYFNHGPYLPQALESLESQSYKNFEVIIVDDGSTDEKSQQVFSSMQQRYSNKKNWHFFHKENGGPERCRNFASRKAVGDYLVFMDSDNIATKDMIKRYASAITKSQVDCLSCWFYGFYGERWAEKVDYIMTFLGGCIELGWERNCFGDTNFIINKDTFMTLGGFSQSAVKRGNEDWAFLAKLCLSGYELDVVHEPLFWYRDREDGFNRTTNRIANKKRIGNVYDSFCQELHHVFCNVVIPMKCADEQKIREYKSLLQGWEGFEDIPSNTYVKFGRSMARLARGVLRRLPSFCERLFSWIMSRF